jgi:hypothetical protein
MLLIPRAQRLRGRLSAEIALAVAKPEAALHQEGDVLALAVDALLDREAQQSRRLKDAEVQRIDVGPYLAAEESGQRRLVGDLVDAVENGPERREAAGLDDRVIEVCGTIVGDFAGGGAGGRRARTVEQREQLPAGPRVDLVAHSPAAQAGGDLGGSQPLGVGPGEEIVAGPRGRIGAAPGRLGERHRADGRGRYEPRARSFQSLSGHGAMLGVFAMTRQHPGPTRLDQFQTCMWRFIGGIQERTYP